MSYSDRNVSRPNRSRPKRSVTERAHTEMAQTEKSCSVADEMLLQKKFDKKRYQKCNVDCK